MPVIPLNQGITTNHSAITPPSQASGFGDAAVLSLVNSTLLPSHQEQAPPLSDEARQSNAIQQMLADYQNHAQTTAAQAPSTVSTPVPLTRAERRSARMPMSTAAVTPQFRHQAKETQAVVRPKERAPSSSSSPSSPSPFPLKAPLQFLEKVTPAQTKAEAKVMVKVEAEIEVEQAEEEKADVARAPELVHKRVKRVIAGDKASAGSHLEHSVGQLVTNDYSRYCTAALVGQSHFLTSAHCVSSNLKACEDPKNFKGASVYLNNKWYQCASYSIPNSCIQATTSDPAEGSNDTPPIPKQTPERRDAVLCHTSHPVSGGFVLPLMSSEDYQQIFNASYTKDDEAQPKGFLAGMGRTGADCKGPLSRSLSLSWSQFVKHTRYSVLNSQSATFAAHKTYQENKNYQICPGDSGSPLLYYNKKTNTYELIGPLARGNDHSFYVDEVVSGEYKTWLEKNNIKPWTENPNPTGLKYYNLTLDEQIHIPFVPVISTKVKSNAFETDTPGTLNQFIKVSLQNNLTNPNLPASENTLYSAQALRYFDNDKTFNHTGTIRTKVPSHEAFSWVYYPSMRLDDFSLSSMTQTCSYQWNQTTLKLFEWDLAHRNQNSSTEHYNNTILEGSQIHNVTASGKKMFGFNITVNSDPANGNLTLLTSPAYLFNSTQVRCENKTFSEDGHYYHSRSEGPPLSPWPAVIALTTAVSFLLKDG